MFVIKVLNEAFISIPAALIKENLTLNKVRRRESESAKPCPHYIEVVKKET